MDNIKLYAKSKQEINLLIRKFKAGTSALQAREKVIQMKGISQPERRVADVEESCGLQQAGIKPLHGLYHQQTAEVADESYQCLKREGRGLNHNFQICDSIDLF